MYVQTDGSFYLATPVDPLFIILPILEQVRMKASVFLYQLSLLVIEEFFFFHDEVFARFWASTQWVVMFLQKGDDMGKFRSMDDIVSVDGFPGYTCLLPFLSASLDILCEVRGELLNLVYFLDEVLIHLRFNIYKMTVVLTPKLYDVKDANSYGLYIGLFLSDEILWLKSLGICKYKLQKKVHLEL